jgi:peptidoglycan LD-endopeptidase LytH
VAAPIVVARVATGLLGEDLGRWAVRLVLLALLAATAPMALAMLAFAGLLGLANGLSGAPSGGGPLRGGPPTQAALATIPPEQLVLMQQVAADSSCHLPWTVLAAIADTESGFGANMATSSAGAVGYGQFLPSTWALPGIGNGGDAYDYHDALPAMARYLCQSGAGQDLRGAIWAYNHADWYVTEVLALAKEYQQAYG